LESGEGRLPLPHFALAIGAIVGTVFMRATPITEACSYAFQRTFNEQIP